MTRPSTKRPTDNHALSLDELDELADVKWAPRARAAA